MVDGTGNVIVTGFTGNVADYTTLKYSGAGMPLWTNRYNGPGNFAKAMAVDSRGNVFVTGESGEGGNTVDYATIAYSSAGVVLWTNRYHGGGSGYDIAFAVVVDGNGNVFVTGESDGTNGYSDFTTIKYSSSIPPSLTIARTTTNTLAVSWPSPSTGWNLQVNPNLTTSNWSTPNETVVDNGTLKFIIVSPPTGNRLYRLKSP